MTRFALPGKVLYRHIKTRCPSEPATSPSITLGLGELNSASKHYTAFISYSHDDAEHVAWLQKRIETFRPQKLLNESAPQSLAPIFKDRDELPSAADLSTVISSALENTRWLIVACSPSAAKSPWVDAEIRQFKRLHGNDRVLAYIVRGEPTATNPEEACFPPALLEKIDAGGQVIGRIEPVAADARPHADGRDNASLKIIAGLLEVGFDALRQRDAQRRQKRLMMISVASVAGFLIASTLATLAVIARNEADEQRQRAEIEARTASRTSEFMVNIFAVAAPSEARGRQITAAEILARGVERIDNLNEAPEIQVNLLHTMGQVHTGLGLYGDATTLLSRAQALRSVQSEEESIATQVALAEALVFKGTYDEAKAEIDTAIDRLPVKVWSTTHSKAYNVLGDVLVKQQKPAAAQTAYRTALDNDRIALESAGEESTNAMANLARSETGVATALVYQGNFAAATPLFQSSLDHYKASLGEDHPQVAVTHNNLGNTYYFLQDWPKVLQQYAQALPLARRLFGDKHPEVAVMLNNFGRLELENGDLARARELLNETIAIYRSKPDVEQEGLVFALNSLGLLEVAAENFSTARSTLEEALQRAPENHRLAGSIRINLMAALCSLGEADQALLLSKDIPTLLQANYPEGDWRYAWAEVQRARCSAESFAESATQLERIKGSENLFARLAKPG